MDEIWRPIPGALQYEVSDMGRVRRIAKGKGTVSGKVLKPFDGGNGYLKVALSCEGVVRKRAVHRLVAEVFLGKPHEKMDAAHWNGDRHDNRLENLRWATRTENMADTERLGRTAKGERNGHAKITAEDVVAIRSLCGGGMTQAQAGAKFGLTRGSVSDITRGRNWSHIQ